MKRVILIKGVAITLIITIMLSVTGCASTVTAHTKNLTEDITAGIPADVSTSDYGKEVSEFGTLLLTKTINQLGEDADIKNILLSPVSVLYVLAMTANGADGETLKQFEGTFGVSLSELNGYLYNYKKELPTDEKYKVSIADSIWYRDTDNLSIEKDFLQTNKDYYLAEIFKSKFNEGTTKDINNWVEKNTDGMIKNILDKIDEEQVMILVNALSFDADWNEIYKPNSNKDGFTKADGSKEVAEYMHSTEEAYLTDGNAVGMVKYYKNNKYGFAALLPEEGMSAADYALSLTGEKLISILADKENTDVIVSIPKFKTEYTTSLVQVLKDMGINEAFSAKSADFTRMGKSSDGNIFIGEVIHKTFIEVDEKGTKAGAATIIEAPAMAAMPAQEPKRIKFNRPFVYMIFDTANSLPLFIGVLNSVE